MRLDNRYSLEVGALSRDPVGSHAFGRSLGIAADRLYPDYRAMAEAEARRADGIEVVSIVTPNDSHYPIARTFLEHGFAVICDKPLTPDFADALALYHLAREKQAIFALTHIYSAYAMVRQAARMVRDGELGEIRIVQVEHASGWAAKALESDGATSRCNGCTRSRMRQAQYLLGSTHHSVERIASQVGFGVPDNFPRPVQPTGGHQPTAYSRAFQRLRKLSAARRTPRPTHRRSGGHADNPTAEAHLAIQT